MFDHGQALSGREAALESKRCLSYGVTLGGDPQGRKQAPIDVEDFLKSVFGANK